MSKDEFEQLEEYENREIIIYPGKARKTQLIDEMGQVFQEIYLGVDLKQDGDVLKIWFFEDK